MKNDNSYEKCLIKFKSNETNFGNVLFAHSARTSFGFPYFNQFLKFLQIFKVFNILRYHGPYPGS